MASEERPERSARPPAMIVTSITVADRPQARGHPLRARLGAISPGPSARIAVAAVAALTAVAAIIVISLPSRQSIGHGDQGRAAELPLRERAAIASALGHRYPLGCLKIAVFADDPNYATAEIGQANGCASYRGYYIDATLHRSGGRWRLLLDEGQLYVPHNLRFRGGSPTARPPARRRPPDCLSARTLLRDPGFARAGFDRRICAPPRPS